MNCNECLSLLETGGPFSRWLARRHLAKCAICTAGWQQWMAVRSELQHLDPLTAVQTAKWMQATSQELPQDSSPSVVESAPRPLPDGKADHSWSQSGRVVVAIVAVCALLAVSLFVTSRPPVDQKERAMTRETPLNSVDSKPGSQAQSVPSTTKTIVISIPLTQELNQLDFEIEATLQEINLLRDQIRRHELNQRINALLAQKAN